ncbi:MAG: hypothetical protein KDK70_28335 [Myxococcales bacterium]|nr:hypothetical protein [Myxococcales bacterium]
MRSVHGLALFILAALAPACATIDPDPLTEHDEAQEFRCPTCGDGRDVGSLNTHGNNGLVVDAVDTTGKEFEGSTLLAVELRGEHETGQVLHDVHAEDGVLYGTDELGVLHSGADFEGSLWTLRLDITLFDVPPVEESTVEWVLKVKSFVSDGARTRYVFVNGPTSGNTEAFSCDMDPETGEFSAILYTDLWVDPITGTHAERPNTIYFGCISGAIGKAGMWGYPQHEVGFQMHQAASRMVRADYCGTGHSFTQTGTPLQMTDELGIRMFPDPGKSTEAMWTESGAACLLEPRRPEHSYESVDCEGEHLPMCDPGSVLADWGALLWSKNLPSTP